VRTAEPDLTEVERAFGLPTECHQGDLETHLARVRQLRDNVVIAWDRLHEKRTALKGVPAKLPANEIDPNATRS
jgi:hypothetical protein